MSRRVIVNGKVHYVNLTVSNPHIEQLREDAEWRKKHGWKFAPTNVGGYVKVEKK